MRNRHSWRARTGTFCAVVLLSAACQPASDLPRDAPPADSTEPPPPPPPLPTGDTVVRADTATPPAAPVQPADTPVVPTTPRATPPPPAPSEGDCTPATVTAGPGLRLVRVFFSCGERVVPVSRTVPETRAVLRSALEQLLRGPTAQERAAGFHSFFGEATEGALRSVVVGGNGVARIDFEDFSRAIPNASTSAGSAQLLDQLRATIFQYSTVRAAEITFAGSCDRFWNWLQRGCTQLRRES